MPAVPEARGRQAGIFFIETIANTQYPITLKR